MAARHASVQRFARNSGRRRLVKGFDSTNGFDGRAALISPVESASARKPARWSIRFTTCAGDTPSDAIARPNPLHGSQSSTPRNRTWPTINSFPTRSLSRTPRVTMLRPVADRSSKRSHERRKASISSASTKVTFCPGSSARPKYRSPSMPLPATTRMRSLLFAAPDRWVGCRFARRSSWLRFG